MRQGRFITLLPEGLNARRFSERIATVVSETLAKTININIRFLFEPGDGDFDGGGCPTFGNICHCDGCSGKKGGEKRLDAFFKLSTERIERV
jgi:hypothetical protein